MSADAKAQAGGVDPEFEALVMRHAAAMNEGRFPDAERTMADVMTAVMERAEEELSPDLFRSVVAENAEESGEWNVARKIYEEELAEAASEERPEAKYYCQARACMHLAQLESLQEKHDLAYDWAKRAVERDSGTSPFGFAFFLEEFAGYALQAGRFDEAIIAATEGLSLLQPERSQDQIRGMLETRLAAGLLKAGHAAEARTHLDSAWKLIEPLSVLKNAAGIQATLCRWWRVEALFREVQMDWPTARDAWDTAIAHCRRVVELWDGGRKSRRWLADLLREYSGISASNDETERSAALISESKSILAELQRDQTR